MCQHPAAMFGFAVLLGIVVALIVLNSVIAGLAFVDEANGRRRRRLTSLTRDDGTAWPVRRNVDP